MGAIVKVTEQTRKALAYRRAARHLQAKGYEEVDERGGKIWELHRGYRQDHRIVDVVISPHGKTVWIKTERAA